MTFVNLFASCLENVIMEVGNEEAGKQATTYQDYLDLY